MATPQMMALDQALAEGEVPQPDPASRPGQLANLARPAGALGHHRDSSLPNGPPSASGGGALLNLADQEVKHGCRARPSAC